MIFQLYTVLSSSIREQNYQKYFLSRSIQELQFVWKTDNLNHPVL